LLCEDHGVVQLCYLFTSADRAECEVGPSLGLDVTNFQLCTGLTFYYQSHMEVLNFKSGIKKFNLCNHTTCNEKCALC